jgi:hypothetical protein
VENSFKFVVWSKNIPVPTNSARPNHPPITNQCPSIVDVFNAKFMEIIMNLPKNLLEGIRRGFAACKRRMLPSAIPAFTSTLDDPVAKIPPVYIP